MDNFYNLLVKDTDNKPGHDLHLDLDGSRHAIEICNRFSKKSNYWMSYLSRTIAELLVALVLLGWVTSYGLPHIADLNSVWWDTVLPCDVYGHMFECSGHPQQVRQQIFLKSMKWFFPALHCENFLL